MPRLSPVSAAIDPLHAGAEELLRREQDALRLFRPFDYQLPLFKTKASEVCARGGNRSGKSVCAAALVASAARQKPLYDQRGRQLPPFRPIGRPQLIWVIGDSDDHIGDTMYRLLFAPGQFPCFYDERGSLRAARTVEEKRLGETQGGPEDPISRPPPIAPPFIPASEFRGRMSFTKASANVFDMVTLLDGTIIRAFNSSGKVKMGDPVDLIWIDEDVQFPQYVAEWQARLSDKKGRLLWSAWPHASNFALRQISARAEKQKNNPKPDVFEQRLSFLDNPLIDEEEKQKRIAGWAESGDSVVRSRVEGEWADEGAMMYPSFGLPIHGIPQENREDDKLTITLRDRGWIPPDHWTRYLTMDPGHTCTSVGLWAVPPPDEFNGVKVRYDELYLAGYTAAEVAERVAKKLAGIRVEAMIIDWSYSRQAVSGLGKTYLQIYDDAFRAAGITPRTGGGFTFSSNDVSAGIMAVRDWLAVRTDGTPTFRVVQHNCANLVKEIGGYRKKFTKDEYQDKPMDGQRDHACDEFRYAAMHGLRWVEPEVPAPSAGNQYEYFRNFWKQDTDQDKPASVTIGVGTKA